jgi:deoxyribose-phosphate aldolase
MTMLSAKDLARCIDQALFTPEATRRDLEQFCAEARQESFRSICVNGSRVELAYALLEESGVQVTALVGFPFGAADSDAKRYETEIAVDQGAHEIEVVMNVGRFKDGDQRYILREWRDLAEAADERPVKVVLQTHLLTRDEIVLACHLALDSGVQFVCNSTGFDTPPVSVEDIKLLRASVGEKFGVKAAGDIRNAVLAQALLDAGAMRIGTVAGVELVKELQR